MSLFSVKKANQEPAKKLSVRGGFLTNVKEDPAIQASVKQQQLAGQQAAKDADKYITDLFKKFDNDNNGYVTDEELEKGLIALGIKLSPPNWRLLEETFPASVKANLAQFKTIMTFFLKIRQEFTKYDKDSSNSINAGELSDFLVEFSFKFDTDTIIRLVSLSDVDATGELSLNEVIELILYLKKLERLFSKEDKDKSGALDPAELQALLRALNIAVSVLELELFLKTRQLSSKSLNFTDFVNLLHDIKANLDEYRKKAKAVRRAGRKVANRDHHNVKLPGPTNLRSRKYKQYSDLVKTLNAQCVASKKKWEDPDFPCNGDLYFPTVKRGAQAIKLYKRISDFPGGKLFVDGIDQGDVKQGALGDCWFLSSLCVLAGQGASTMKDLFTSVNIDTGVVQCRFFKDNDWQFVTIDDRIPCGANGQPCFASCRDSSELWVPLIEKAYAKLHGNFEAIESGSITDGLVDLTGEGSEVLDIQKTDNFWNMLHQGYKSGYLMGCAAQAAGAGVEEATPLGILMLHAYGVLKVVEVDDFKLVCVRNPWGRHEWRGRWSDNSKEWTPEIMKKLDVKFEDDGVFWMEYYDFCKHFNKLYVLRSVVDESGHQWQRYDFLDEWKGESAGGCLNNPTWSKNPQFRFRSTTETKVFVSLRQPDLRVRQRKTPVYKAIGFAVLKKGDDSDQKKTTVTKADLVAMSPFFAGREISAEFKALPNVSYIIIPSFFEKGVESTFYVSIYTHQKDCKVDHLGKPPRAQESDDEDYSSEEEEEESKPTPAAQVVNVNDPTKKETQQLAGSITVSSAWIKDKTAGGCPVNPLTWKTSPQFILELPKGDKVNIRVKQTTTRSDGKYHHIGFFVFKSELAKKRKFNTTEIVHQTEFINAQESGAEVSLPLGAYNILVCTYQPNLEGEFELTVKGSTAASALKLYELTPSNDWKALSMDSKWGPGRDGGCSNNQATWMSNPQFSLVVGEKSFLKIVLDVAEEAKCAVGFYVFATKDGKKPSAVNTISPFVQPNNLQHIIVTKDVELDAGTYIIMPATYVPNNHARFQLNAYCDHQKLSLTPLN